GIAEEEAERGHRHRELYAAPHHAVEVGVGGKVPVVHQREVVMNGALRIHVGEAQPEEVCGRNHEEEHEEQHGRGEESRHCAAPPPPAHGARSGRLCREPGSTMLSSAAHETVTASPSANEGRPLGICSITRSLIPSGRRTSYSLFVPRYTV